MQHMGMGWCSTAVAYGSLYNGKSKYVRFKKQRSKSNDFGKRDPATLVILILDQCK